MDFEFSPGAFESHKTETGWLKVGGIALTPGKSKNNKVYTFKNIQENDGGEFKWMVGHPKQEESHIVGKGVFKVEGRNLVHEGRIRNTKTHPDVVESVFDGFLEPSIHASAKKVTKSVKEGTVSYDVEGLSIRGVGLVAFKGIKSASIDYAIAESFRQDLEELKESLTGDEQHKDKEENPMAEEKPVKEEEEAPEAPEEKKDEAVPEPEPATEPPAEESARIAALEKELASIKESKKVDLVESILKLNDKLDKDELMKESEDVLRTKQVYEEKLAKPSEEGAIVEEVTVENKNELVERKDGSTQLSEKAQADFNKELRERV